MGAIKNYCTDCGEEIDYPLLVIDLQDHNINHFCDWDCLRQYLGQEHIDD